MKRVGDLVTFLYRIFFLYAVFMLCRAFFYIFNSELIGTISWSEVPLLIKGSLVFDSVSIFYLNIPFLLFSLLPFRFRGKKWYQTSLLWLFVVVNAAGLFVNMGDIFYYPYKLARVASDDIHFTTNGNFVTLMQGFVIDLWYGFLLWGGVVLLLWWGFKRIRYRATEIKNSVVYYLSQTLALAVCLLLAVVLIRGGNISGATYPIAISDATLYASPSKAGLILSNPFALIRTINQSVSYPEYFAADELEREFTPIHKAPGAGTLEGEPNVVFLILESFGSAHIKALSSEFPADRVSYTPFLDSLMGEGFLFTNAYHNGIRSIDALPALWSSIPSFKTQFLSLPQSMAKLQSLPDILGQRGYSTAFMHGAVRESMSFVAFGKAVGVKTFFSQEEYELERGKGDFDGKWGIWDHKFLPFVGEKLSTLPQPFFATIFTLSSHHPFILPDGFDYPAGTEPIHHMMRYSDDALKRLFKQISTEPWYENTLFVITADHSSGADNDKYRRVPYNFAVPILFYSPKGLIKGRYDHAAGHIDVMPTVLGLLGHDKPYFAFGRDVFNDSLPERTINYLGAFNVISDSTVMIFNEREVLSSYNYKNGSEIDVDTVALKWTKGLVQQYYKHIKERDFVAK